MALRERELTVWWEWGKDVAWILAEYERMTEYSLTESELMAFVKSRGLERRYLAPGTIVPWNVRPEHQSHPALELLTLEGLRLEGIPVPEDKAEQLADWREALDSAGLVIDYDPAEGFVAVEARLGLDTRLIRETGPMPA